MSCCLKPLFFTFPTGVARVLNSEPAMPPMAQIGFVVAMKTSPRLTRISLYRFPGLKGVAAGAPGASIVYPAVTRAKAADFRQVGLAHSRKIAQISQHKLRPSFAPGWPKNSSRNRSQSALSSPGLIEAVNSSSGHQAFRGPDCRLCLTCPAFSSSGAFTADCACLIKQRPGALSHPLRKTRQSRLGAG